MQKLYKHFNIRVKELNRGFPQKIISEKMDAAIRAWRGRKSRFITGERICVKRLARNMENGMN